MSISGHLRFVIAAVTWPFEGVRKAIGWKYTLRHTIRWYSYRFDKHIDVPAGFQGDHSSLSPNLIQQLIPPILSDAQWIHDWMYERGTWNDGTPCTFEEANWCMTDRLRQEGHPAWLIEIYRRGVWSVQARNAWLSHRAHDAQRSIRPA